MSAGKKLKGQVYQTAEQPPEGNAVNLLPVLFKWSGQCDEKCTLGKTNLASAKRKKIKRKAKKKKPQNKKPR